MTDGLLECALREHGGVVVRGDLLRAGVEPRVVRRALVDGRLVKVPAGDTSHHRCPSSERWPIGIPRC